MIGERCSDSESGNNGTRNAVYRTSALSKQFYLLVRNTAHGK